MLYPGYTFPAFGLLTGGAEGTGQYDTTAPPPDRPPILRY
jgi:hypothetical protein